MVVERERAHSEIDCIHPGESAYNFRFKRLNSVRSLSLSVRAQIVKENLHLDIAQVASLNPTGVRAEDRHTVGCGEACDSCNDSEGLLHLLVSISNK